jgi:hypothetical protein
MTWSSDQIHQIPEVYVDFLLALRAVIETRRGKRVLKVTAIPYGRIFEYLRTKHGLEPHEIREIADTLRERGFVEMDRLGFVTPTETGEELIDVLADEEQAAPSRVPPFPNF